MSSRSRQAHTIRSLDCTVAEPVWGSLLGEEAGGLNQDNASGIASGQWIGRLLRAWCCPLDIGRPGRSNLRHRWCPNHHRRGPSRANATERIPKPGGGKQGGSVPFFKEDNWDRKVPIACLHQLQLCLKWITRCPPVSLWRTRSLEQPLSSYRPCTGCQEPNPLSSSFRLGLSLSGVGRGNSVYVVGVDSGSLVLEWYFNRVRLVGDALVQPDGSRT